jgi:hypothetical protein
VLSDRCFFFRNNFWRPIAFFKAFLWCELLFTSDTFDQNIITLSLPIVLSNQEGGPSAFSFLRWKYVPPVFCFFRLSTTDVFIRCWRSILSTRNFRRLITQHCRGAFTPGKFGWPFSRQWCVLEHTNRVDILRCCVDESDEYMCIYETKCFISIFICLSYCHHLMTQSAIFPHSNC